MMLIKNLIAVNADVHRIISTVCGQNEENISSYVSESIILNLLYKIYDVVYM